MISSNKGSVSPSDEDRLKCLTVYVIRQCWRVIGYSPLRPALSCIVDQPYIVDQSYHVWPALSRNRAAYTQYPLTCITHFDGRKGRGATPFPAHTHHTSHTHTHMHRNTHYTRSCFSIPCSWAVDAGDALTYRCVNESEPNDVSKLSWKSMI